MSRLGVTIALAVQLAYGAGAAADCLGDADGWTDTAPAINLAHVFCGELRGTDRPAGFHATVALGDPGAPVLVSFEQDDGGRVEVTDGTAPEPSPDPAGIFTAIVRFSNGRDKFSTFFPMACSADEILASIRHAHGDAAPAATTWGWIGPSAPDDAAAGYCLSNGDVFDIRLGYLGDGRINTAFPHR